MVQTSFTVPITLVCGLALAGCSGSSSETTFERDSSIASELSTNSRVVALNADGTLPANGINRRNSLSVLSITENGGFAYQLGRVDGQNQFLGVAGIAPETVVGSAPTAASATYRGQSSLGYANRTEFGPPVTGTISLNADFNTRLLTGQSGGLTIDGTIDGQTLGGTASYRGVDASLTGRIGSARAVGAFAGDTDDAVLTGGFIAEAQ